jgi:hypothetical protein
VLATRSAFPVPEAESERDVNYGGNGARPTTVCYERGRNCDESSVTRGEKLPPSLPSAFNDVDLVGNAHLEAPGNG